MAAEEALRSNAYKLPSKRFHPPEEELEALIEEAADEEFPLRIDPGLIEDLRTLRVDHAKLFVGPFELLATPYESIYVDDAELEFVYYLVEKEPEALAEGDRETAAFVADDRERLSKNSV